MKTLFLVRHAEASPRAPGASDHDRSLAPLGRRGAEWIGARIASHPVPPTLLLCSSARRAVETLEAFRPSLPRGAQAQIERGLYLADGEQLLGWIREVDAPDAGLLLVGHNPGIGWLARSLLRPDPGAAGLPSGFPAGSLAVFSFDADCWLDVHTQGGTLVGFTVPAPDASR